MTTAQPLDPRGSHRRTCSAFAEQVASIGDDAWHEPTPCDRWDVRDLVAHVVDEDRWTPPLLGGSTIAEVGDRFDHDPLGADPGAAAAKVAEAARAAVSGLDDPATVVHLSFGDVPATEYLWQLTADHLVHGWDLARALGRPYEPDPGVVAACAAWFDRTEDDYRRAGAIGPAVAGAADDDTTARLMGRFGRRPDWTPVHGVVERFDEAFGRGDVDAILAWMTPDAVFEDTSPPDGRRHVGAEAIRAVLTDLFTHTADPRFRVEELEVCGEKVTQVWTYTWRPTTEGPDHVRGVDLLTVRGGRVVAKRSWVKG
jgi:uncharacterized protein (TIGR03086 family)